MKKINQNSIKTEYYFFFPFTEEKKIEFPIAVGKISVKREEKEIKFSLKRMHFSQPISHFCLMFQI